MSWRRQDNGPALIAQLSEEVKIANIQLFI